MDLYELRVAGHLDAATRHELNPISETELPSGLSLVVPARDQAEVQGLIARVAAGGLELIEIRRVPERSATRSDPAGRPGG